MSTEISWADETWNPWVGCSEIARECGRHGPNADPESALCYACGTACRKLHDHWKGTAHKGKWTGVINRAPPSTWQKPFRLKPGVLVFTCSMSDFWHENVPLDWLAEALDVVDRTPHLTYQVLTKRAGNIARRLAALKRGLPRNCWLGATVGHPSSFGLLRPLLAVEARFHFLSSEPLLASLAGLDLRRVDWVIGGGQSGSGAVRCDPDWMRELRDICIATDTAFFLKQWGTWDSNPTPCDQELAPDEQGGATLDGRLWREYPV